MSNNFGETMKFKLPSDESKEIKDILKQVYKSLSERDYQPENQIIGYILSGDPTYITSHGDARKFIRQVDRDELLEELLEYYLENNNIK